MTMRAVCIGLNYPGTPSELRGCINDARDWTSALTDRGYTVTPLLEPSRAQIIDALREHVARTRYRDRLVVTYSGHGTWLPDRDGDEPDGRDEALVPADYRTAGVLLDDTLAELFAPLPFGSRALMLSDSCHSGTVTRSIRAQPADAPRPRYLPLSDLDLPRATMRAALAAEPLPPHTTPRPSRVALISGSTDLEYSYDVMWDGRPRGAFTATALAALPPGPITLRTWHTAIRRNLPTPSWPQTPQLDATPWQTYTWTL